MPAVAAASRRQLTHPMASLHRLNPPAAGAPAVRPPPGSSSSPLAVCAVSLNFVLLVRVPQWPKLLRKDHLCSTAVPPSGLWRPPACFPAVPARRGPPLGHPAAAETRIGPSLGARGLRAPPLLSVADRRKHLLPRAGRTRPPPTLLSPKPSIGRTGPILSTGWEARASLPAASASSRCRPMRAPDLLHRQHPPLAGPPAVRPPPATPYSI
ncbi:uncharacterized protein LOC109716219 [Ananas comosus]|uniref:Uncharacterized protein LOC109716219 n=1 Tax=Ananas comosus TaxID=4615 RepID=A0A6P5FMF1_ANACO|nr:uncharacterized protein LOC109716219 [Ananas comosus]